jgi:hypothetical protein
MRLFANVEISESGGGTWSGQAIIDNGSPITLISHRVLRNVGAQPTGGYCPRNRRNPSCIIQPGTNTIFYVYLETEATPKIKLKVYAAQLAIETEVLLGMD